MRKNLRKLGVWEALFCLVALLGVVVVAGAIGGVTSPIKPHTHPPTSDINEIPGKAIPLADLVAQQEMANWAFGTMIVGFFTMLGSFAALLFIRSTLQATQDTLDETRKRNAIEMRAYLVVIPRGIETWIGEPEFVGQIEIHNIGKTPARDVSCQVRMKNAEFKEANFETQSYNNLAKRSLLPGARMRQGSKNRLPIDKIAEQWPNFIYVYGSVHYTDYSGERRQTTFCHRYNKSAVQPELRTIRQMEETRVLIDAEKARHHVHGNDAS